MKLAFTGTRQGMTDTQYAAVHQFLMYKEIDEFHHGGAKGADSEVHELVVRVLCIPWEHVHIWPSFGRNLSWFRGLGVIHEPGPPLERNHVIVDHGVDGLIAAPKEAGEILRSGTWATVRYARKVNRIIHLFPPT